MLPSIYVKQLRDVHNSEYYTIYELGNISKPLMVMTRGELVRFKIEIEEALLTIFNMPVFEKEG